MPKRRRWLTRRVLAVLGSLLIAAALVAWFFGLPWLLRYQINSKLRDAGIRDVRFKVARATPWGSRLSDVTGGSAVRIDAVDIGYTLRDLWHGRLDAIRLVGAAVTLRVIDGKVDPEPITSLVTFGRAAKTPRTGEPTPSATRPATSARSATRPAPPLPIELFSFRDSTLTFVTPTRTVRVPVSGSMHQDPSNRLKVRLDAGENQSLLIDAMVDPSARQATFEGGAHAGRALDTVRAIWPDAEVSVAGRMLLKGSANWKGDELAASARLEIASAAESDAPAAPTSKAGSAVASGDKLHLGGGVFEVDVRGPARKRRVEVRIADASLSSAEGVSVEGVGGMVTFSQLTPPATPPGQVLRAGKLKIGELELTNGELEFALNDGRTITIPETRWHWLGGEVWANNVNVALGGDAPLRATLNVRDIDLKSLLEAYAEGKLEGEGKLSGQLPITVRGRRVEFGNGRLGALAGGSLRIKDEQMVNQVAGQAGSSDVVKRNITGALKDFEYDRLSASFIDEPDGQVTRIELAGHGRTGEKQAMSFDLRFAGKDREGSGLEAVFNAYLGLQSAVSAARERVERGEGLAPATRSAPAAAAATTRSGKAPTP